MADAGWRFFAEREVAALEPQGDLYQGNEYRDFNQGSDDGTQYRLESNPNRLITMESLNLVIIQEIPAGFPQRS